MEKIAVIGLGLMGGSLAKAFKHYTSKFIGGYDIIPDIAHEALRIGAIDRVVDLAELQDFDMIILALCPRQAVDFVKSYGEGFRKNAIVMDICGVKAAVCSEITPIAQRNGFIFIGAHPMAGREFSGFEYSKFDLYRGASLVFTPETGEQSALIPTLSELFGQLGFDNIKITTPALHDRMIAFTSQLAHVVSNAYVKSPEAILHHGFSAGSYKDLTRVAKLNENMWTELFMLNADNLAEEIDGIVAELQKYSGAIRCGDGGKLKELLREGRERKESIDR